MKFNETSTKGGYSVNDLLKEKSGGYIENILTQISKKGGSHKYQNLFVPIGLVIIPQTERKTEKCLEQDIDDALFDDLFDIISVGSRNKPNKTIKRPRTK